VSLPVHLRRSVLYVPGSNARALEKARDLPVDAIILDLEDAVAPTAKHDARQAVLAALASGAYGNRELIVRINSLSTPWGEADLRAFATSKAAAVLLPKVSSAGDIRAAEAVLPDAMPIWAMIETPKAVLNVREIAASGPQLKCLVMGLNDLAKDMQVELTATREAFQYALSACVLAARAYNLCILDGVYTALQDNAGFEAQCAQGRMIGFDGKTLIHPNQIDVANRIFAPSAEAISKAEAIVVAWQAGSDKGVVVVDGQMVERLHVEQAERTLHLAKLIAEK
jgi:citrate lyase subunit beta/citryl-CoA lyase